MFNKDTLQYIEKKIHSKRMEMVFKMGFCEIENVHQKAIPVLIIKNKSDAFEKNDTKVINQIIDNIAEYVIALTDNKYNKAQIKKEVTGIAKKMTAGLMQKLNVVIKLSKLWDATDAIKDSQFAVKINLFADFVMDNQANNFFDNKLILEFLKIKLAKDLSSQLNLVKLCSIMEDDANLSSIVYSILFSLLLSANPNKKISLNTNIMLKHARKLIKMKAFSEATKLYKYYVNSCSPDVEVGLTKNIALDFGVNNILPLQKVFKEFFKTEYEAKKKPDDDGSKEKFYEAKMESLDDFKEAFKVLTHEDVINIFSLFDKEAKHILFSLGCAYSLYFGHEKNEPEGIIDEDRYKVDESAWKFRKQHLQKKFYTEYKLVDVVEREAGKQKNEKRMLISAVQNYAFIYTAHLAYKLNDQQCHISSYNNSINALAYIYRALLTKDLYCFYTNPMYKRSKSGNKFSAREKYIISEVMLKYIEKICHFTVVDSDIEFSRLATRVIQNKNFIYKLVYLNPLYPDDIQSVVNKIDEDVPRFLNVLMYIRNQNISALEKIMRPHDLACFASYALERRFGKEFLPDYYDNYWTPLVHAIYSNISMVGKKKDDEKGVVKFLLEQIKRYNMGYVLKLSVHRSRALFNPHVNYISSAISCVTGPIQLSQTDKDEMIALSPDSRYCSWISANYHVGENHMGSVVRGEYATARDVIDYLTCKLNRAVYLFLTRSVVHQKTSIDVFNEIISFIKTDQKIKKFKLEHDQKVLDILFHSYDALICMFNLSINAEGGKNKDLKAKLKAIEEDDNLEADKKLEEGKKIFDEVLQLNNKYLKKIRSNLVEIFMKSHFIENKSRHLYIMMAESCYTLARLNLLHHDSEDASATPEMVYNFILAAMMNIDMIPTSQRKHLDIFKKHRYIMVYYRAKYQLDSKNKMSSFWRQQRYYSNNETSAAQLVNTLLNIGEKGHLDILRAIIGWSNNALSILRKRFPDSTKGNVPCFKFEKYISAVKYFIEQDILRNFNRDIVNIDDLYDISPKEERGAIDNIFDIFAKMKGFAQENSPSKNMLTPIQYLFQHKHLDFKIKAEAILILLQGGAKAKVTPIDNYKNIFEWAIGYADQNNKCKDIIEFLVKAKKVDPNIKLDSIYHTNNNNLLQWAIYNSHESLAQTLLFMGARCEPEMEGNALDEAFKKMCLVNKSKVLDAFVAVSAQYLRRIFVKCVKYLVEYAECKNKHLENKSCDNVRNYTFNLIKKHQNICGLRQHFDADNNSAIHLLAKADELRLVKLLVLHGADLASKNKAGKSVLDMAKTTCKKKVSKFNRKSCSKKPKLTLHKTAKYINGIVRLFKCVDVFCNPKTARKGADLIKFLDLLKVKNLVQDINVMFNEETLLHMAARYNRPDVVKLLLAKGANRKALNSDGKMPFQVTIRKEIQELLNVGVYPSYNDSFLVGFGNSAMMFSNRNELRLISHEGQESGKKILPGNGKK